MRLHKCKFCSQLISMEEEIPYKNGYAHQRCFQVHVKTLKQEKDKTLAEKASVKKGATTKPKPKKELKDGLSEEEWKEKQAYYDFLRQLTSEEITAKQRAITERYLNKEYGFTYAGMKQALEYYFIILEKEMSGDCVGIIPWCYDDAVRYFNSLKQTEIANQNFSEKDTYKTKTLVYKPKKRKTDGIDITQIGAT